MACIGVCARKCSDYFTTLELVVFAKKQLSCNFQAGWPWMSEDQARPQGHSTPVRAGLPRGHVPCRGPGTGSQAVSFPQGLGWGTESEKQLCTLFPPPSCPAWVWGLVSLLSGTSPWKKTSKKFFLHLCSTSNVQGGFLHPLYLDHQRRSPMVTNGHSSKRKF